MLDTVGSLGLPQLGPPTLGLIPSPRPASLAPTRVLEPADTVVGHGAESLGINTIEGVVLVAQPSVGYLPSVASTGLIVKPLPQKAKSGKSLGTIPIKAPPMVQRQGQPVYAGPPMPLVVQMLGQIEGPPYVVQPSKKATPKPPPPVMVSAQVPKPPPARGRSSTPPRGTSQGTPSQYRSIAHWPAVREITDGSRLVEQLSQVLAGMAPLREVVGSLRSITTGRGATLPYDGVRIIKGIYIAGLDRNLGNVSKIPNFPILATST